jgi:hypothetical protein
MPTYTITFNLFSPGVAPWGHVNTTFSIDGVPQTTVGLNVRPGFGGLNNLVQGGEHAVVKLLANVRGPLQACN